MGKEKKVRIQIMIHPKLLHSADIIASESEVSRSKLFEIALIHLIKTGEEMDKEQEKKGKA